MIVSLHLLCGATRPWGPSPRHERQHAAEDVERKGPLEVCAMRWYMGVPSQDLYGTMAYHARGFFRRMKKDNLTDEQLPKQPRAGRSIRDRVLSAAFGLF